jgi:hypothetical protein
MEHPTADRLRDIGPGLQELAAALHALPAALAQELHLAEACIVAGLLLGIVFGYLLATWKR